MNSPIWCHLRELRELGLAQRLFIEDDARPPDAETLGQAFYRLFGRALPNWNNKVEWTESWDGGDAFYAFNKINRIVVCWSPGESDIHKLIPGLEDFKPMIERWNMAAVLRLDYDSRRAYSACSGDLRHFLDMK
jgi:hypothetical protein